MAPPLAAPIPASKLAGKPIEFHHKMKAKDFEDPGKYRIGTVRKVSDGYVYVRCLGYNYTLRVKKEDVIGQITHRFTRKIDWNN